MSSLFSSCCLWRPRPERIRRLGWLRFWRWTALGLVILAGGLGALSLSAAESARVEEYQLKAAFLSKFPLFVEWPAPPVTVTNQQLTIGVLGENPFGAHLEAACRDKTVGGRVLVPKWCQTLAEARTCQIVFVAASEKGRLPEILTTLTASGTLVVGDLPQFAESGGMIGLVADNRKVRMEINMEAVRKGGLRIDPQLLQMARVLHAEPAAAPAK